MVELKSFETERQRLLSRVAERDQKLRELEARVAKVERLEAELAQKNARIAALESELSEALDWSAPAPADDLTKIRGIGPKFAQALQAMGVTTFAAMAAWSEADVARVAAALKIPANRIVKSGWIESARSFSKK